VVVNRGSQPDFVGAGLSFASAIPFAGYAASAGKAVRGGTKLAATAAEGAAKTVKHAHRPRSGPRQGSGYRDLVYLVGNNGTVLSGNARDGFVDLAGDEDHPDFTGAAWFGEACFLLPQTACTATTPKPGASCLASRR